jgi:hypothetical protein
MTDNKRPTRRRGFSRYTFPLIACASLGLAPFVPEPHIVGKLRWVLGGARGMSGLDWFDLAYHGAPWIWLLVVVLLDLRRWAVGGRAAAPAWREPWLWVGLALVAAATCVVVANLG